MICVTTKYPLPRIQTGTLEGNSFLGLMIWGEKNVLNITVGCASLWDHRGGLDWSPKQNYRDVFSALKAKDGERLKTIFQPEKKREGPACPTLLPLGRLILTLKDDCRLLRNELFPEDGLTRVIFENCGMERSVSVRINMQDKNTFSVEMDNSSRENIAGIRLLPAWDLWEKGVGHPNGIPDRFMSNGCGIKDPLNKLAERGISEPVRFHTGDRGGFVQTLPCDDPFGAAFCRKGNSVTVRFARNEAVSVLEKELKSFPCASWSALERENKAWWADFWKEVPKMTTGDEVLDELYWSGMYKFAAMTSPDGVVPGLQGPFIEDSLPPPWQGDYHFNINVEMCYSPALKSGKFANLKHLFDMVFSWMGVLGRNAECFCGIKDGVMLPHAVDDRCTCMGNFWSGIVDHGCTAWIAQMMYDYCDYSGDIGYLREKVFDFMKRTMNVYKVQLERDENGTLFLPLGVSPEYRGSDLDAWGKNSSFTLAAIHRLAANLISASKLLGIQPDPFWLEVEEKLPPYCKGKDGGIMIWEGTDLEESHRHHSHLAGISPFCTLDPEDSRYQKDIDKAQKLWTWKGMGAWTGWCMPWAAKIKIAVGQPAAAQGILHLWKKFFTNEGGGSLHNPNSEGFSVFYAPGMEVMQMDGVMGMVEAIQECFVQQRGNVLCFFGGFPPYPEKVSFEGMFAPGGFRISGKFEGNRQDLVIHACRANTLRIRLPQGVWHKEDGSAISPGVFETGLNEGETLHLSGTLPD